MRLRGGHHSTAGPLHSHSSQSRCRTPPGYGRADQRARGREAGRARRSIGSGKGIVRGVYLSAKAHRRRVRQELRGGPQMP